jgi:predicted fused transcriptional regulator/phosphomethylpyrimidine kinase/predicted transcriptional regulator
MQFICEIIPSVFLTPLRRALAKELADLGFVQTEISRILGVSQPVISSYLRASTSPPSPLVSKPAFEEIVSDLVSRIKSETITPIEMMEAICKECQDFRTVGPLCDIHRKKNTIDFPPDCNLCFPARELVTIFDHKRQITKELYDAAQQLISSGEKFGQLIPEIGCQFVSIIEGSESIADVVGFPGRIVKVKGKGRIVAYPEFSQGATLAKILTHFQKRGSAYRALISLRKTEEILETISAEKSVVSTEEGDKDWDKTLWHFKSEDFQKIESIADTGGLGLEPILYLFGKSPAEIATFLISKF